MRSLEESEQPFSAAIATASAILPTDSGTIDGQSPQQSQQPAPTEGAEGSAADQQPSGLQQPLTNIIRTRSF